MKFDVLFRVDAGGEIGLGHLRRSMALAYGFKRCGVKRIGYLTRTAENLRERLGNDCPIFESKAASFTEEIQDWKVLFSQIGQPRLLIVDRYGIKKKTFEGLKKITDRLITVDDQGLLPFYPVDGIINHNVYGETLKYRLPKGARSFLGRRYTLVGEEFLSFRKNQPSRRTGTPKLYIALGGFARKSAVNRMEKALQLLKNKVDCFWANGKVKSVVKHMAACDLAFSASGTTSYELAYLGIPSLLVILAENQRRVAETMNVLGAARNLGWLNRLTPNKIAQEIEDLVFDAGARERMSRTARAVIDGQGSYRLAKELKRSYLR